jgi:non-ribosomal peptide synthetase component E (peptide arylation enzyme)
VSPFTIRPPESRTRAYRAVGVWRDYGSIGCLRRWRDETPQALAVSAFGPSDAPVRIGHHAYAHLVECFSGALYELAVRPGHVVAIQLPNWWQALVLFEAVARLVENTVRASDSYVRRFSFNEGRDRQVAFSRHHRQSSMRLPWRVDDDAWTW